MTKLMLIMALLSAGMYGQSVWDNPELKQLRAETEAAELKFHRAGAELAAQKEFIKKLVRDSKGSKSKHWARLIAIEYQKVPALKLKRSEAAYEAADRIMRVATWNIKNQVDLSHIGKPGFDEKFQAWQRQGREIGEWVEQMHAYLKTPLPEDLAPTMIQALKKLPASDKRDTHIALWSGRLHWN